MTDDETVVIGEWLDTVFANPWWTRVKNEFAQSAAHQFLNTIPPAASEREEIYYTFNGAKQFLDFLMGIVEAKEDILKERSILLDEEDELLTQDDYSSAHQSDGTF